MKAAAEYAARTITVASPWTGQDKVLTKPEFVARWVDHASELNALVSDVPSRAKVRGIVEGVERLAGAEFERLHAAQNR